MDDQPKRKGGRPKGLANPNAGRPKGAPNLVTRDLAAAAREYTKEALTTLAQIMRAGDSDSARMAAAEAILSRGYGKPRQAMEIAGDQANPLRMITDKPMNTEEWAKTYGRTDTDLGASGGAAESTH